MGGQGERAAAHNKSTRYNRTPLMQTAEMSVHVCGKYGCMFMLWRMSILLLFVKMLRFGQRNYSSLMTQVPSPDFMWQKERANSRMLSSDLHTGALNNVPSPLNELAYVRKYVGQVWCWMTLILALRRQKQVGSLWFWGQGGLNGEI